MSFDKVDWPTIAAMCTVLAFGGAIVVTTLRSQLAHYFVTRREYADMNDRLEAAERKLVSVPSHEDIKSIMDRLATGQGKFDVLAARMDGIGSAIGRVESQLDMLVRSQLERERGVQA